MTPDEIEAKRRGLKDAVQKTENQIEWPEVQELKHELLPVLSITSAMLPEYLSCWLEDIVERMDNAPLEFAAVAAISAASGLIGRKLSIAPKQHDDWEVVPNVWGCCIGSPSIKKSPVIKAVLEPIHDIENTWSNQFDSDMEEYKVHEKITALVNKDAEEKAKKLIKNGKLDEAHALLADNSGDTEKPIQRRFVINNATVESVGEILSKNPTGVLLFRDELSGWMAKLQREDGREDRAFYLEAFNGNGRFSYDRIGRGHIKIPSNTVAVIGGIQPRKLVPLLQAQREGLGDDGFVERLQLAVYPDNPSFEYVDRAPNLEARNKAHNVFQRLADIPYVEDRENRPVLRFDELAQWEWNDWYKALNNKLRSGDYGGHMESHLGKYAALCTSLALIFHVIDKGVDGPIESDSLQKAMQWCELLHSHAARIYGLVDNPVSGAKALLKRLGKLPNPFKMQEFKDKGWAGFDNAADRLSALSILEVHGYIKTVNRANGGRPSVDYYINPEALKIS